MINKAKRNKLKIFNKMNTMIAIKIAIRGVNAISANFTFLLISSLLSI